MYASGKTAIRACTITFPLLATIAVGLRVQARRINSTLLGADDYVMILALVRRRCYSETLPDFAKREPVCHLRRSQLDPVCVIQGWLWFGFFYNAP